LAGIAGAAAFMEDILEFHAQWFAAFFETDLARGLAGAALAFTVALHGHLLFFHIVGLTR
jgi:hypothetical protein